MLIIGLFNVRLAIFSFMVNSFCITFKESFPKIFSKVMRYSPMSSLTSFIVLPFTFISVFYLEVFFFFLVWCEMRPRLNLFFWFQNTGIKFDSIWYQIDPAPCIENTILFPLNWDGTRVINQVWGSVSVLSICLFIYPWTSSALCQLVQLYWVLIPGSVNPSILFVFKIVLVICSPLHFLIHFRSSLLIPTHTKISWGLAVII